VIDPTGAGDRVAYELGKSALLEPVGNEETDLGAWRDYELASFVENRLGITADWGDLDDEDRRDFITRATLPGEVLDDPRNAGVRRFWIRSDAERIGTVAFSTMLLGRELLGVSSLYVHTARRGRGHARAALDAIHQASLAGGLSGIRLSTAWSWQRAVRSYLSYGMWVWGWKRSLDFIRRRELPSWSIALDGDVARFLVRGASAWRTLLEARRTGARLEWLERGPRDERGELNFLAPGTFAVALAVRGFPLITSDAAWRTELDRGFSDCGGPEGLALKIRRFEAWDRKHGWQTPAPRIPGLDYPDWECDVRT
jgi:ribosomal protein S18 acetylase RimI-like enzyme